MSTPASHLPLNSPSLNASQDPTREWHKLFQAPVEEDDPIWKEYIKEAAAFDNRMIDEWNRVIDVVLVYVALFTAVVTAFAIETAQQFQPDPAYISTQLLVAMYKNQLAALQNSSPDIIDTASLFQQGPADYHKAVFNNALIFGDLALSVIVSMIALFAKLWVISYNDRVNASGSPYERAMQRQEAYSGVLTWKLGAIIDSLPFLLLIAVFMFGMFIYQSIKQEQSTIGYVIGAMVILALIFLILVAIVAAFIPACPFYSFLSTLIKLLFNLFPEYNLPERMVGPKISRMKPGLVRIVSITLVSVAMVVATIICVLRYSGAYYPLICFPFAAGVSILGNPPRSDQIPPKYGIQNWILLASVTIGLVLVIAGYFSTRPTIFIGLFCAGGALVALFTIVGTQVYKFTPDTREADAVSWLLKWTPSQKPSYFRKAGQISKQPKHEPASKYEHRKALLLNSLLPLLSPLITSKIRYQASEGEELKTEDLEIYVACLAQLSAFTDSEGSLWKNQAALAHPSPPNAESLTAILRTLEGNPNHVLRSAATDALRYYRAEENSV